MRISSIDSIRGMAIFVMIGANSFSYLFPFETCPELLRICFSTAAPVFIFLSGFSFRLAAENAQHSRKLIMRCIQILFFAISLDTLFWRIYPFFTMDVLYLISFSLILLFFLMRFSDCWIMFLSLLFLSSVLFIGEFYYFNITEITFDERFSWEDAKFAIHHFLIDGWFPFLPWSGVCFLGFIASKYRFIFASYINQLLIVGVVCLIGYCGAYLLDFSHVNTLRNGYCELFYPVSISFMFFILGLLAIIIFLISKNWQGWYWMGELGRFSLPAYFIHTVFIIVLLPFFYQTKESFSFWIMMIGLLLLYLGVISYLMIIRKIVKNKSLNSRAVIRFLLGL